MKSSLLKPGDRVKLTNRFGETFPAEFLRKIWTASNQIIFVFRFQNWKPLYDGDKGEFEGTRQFVARRISPA